MATVVTPEHGKAMLIEDRDKLVAVLDQLLRSRPVRSEIARRRGLREKLAELEREARPRTTAIVPLPSLPGQSWPQGIALARPGLLTIAFGSAEQLLGCVLALAEDAAGNYEAFAARLAAKPIEATAQVAAQERQELAL